MLTNEQLFELYINGSEEIKPVLWERVQRFMYMQASIYFSKYTEYCTRNGVEEQDIMQQSYIAFENSFKTYSPEKSKFTTYLAIMFKASLRDLFDKREPINEAVSLDKPVNNLDNESQSETLGDFIEDKSAFEMYRKVERAADHKHIRIVLNEALSKLDEKQRAVLKERYYKKRSRAETAAILNTTVERIKQEEANAMRILRKNRDIWRLQKYM